ncbi:MAG: SDR family oxidoreductase [Acidimicrobiia bacterium]|nr:SDR family oxidoreductase [Acidimicrobiia bacterium]
MNRNVVVITGGTGSLGTALAKRLAASGAALAVTYLIPEEAEKFEAELHLDETRLLLKRVDSTSASSLNEFMSQAVTKFGSVNGLAALVGGWAGGRDIDETDDVRLERMLDLNLRSAFYAVRAITPHLKENGSGRIVLVGSRGADDGPSGQAAFNIAKAGVGALGRSAASELSDFGITTNVVQPSVIDTPATRRAVPFADYVSWPTPDEIAAVIEFLLSDASSVMSGATLPVYGNT